MPGFARADSHRNRASSSYSEVIAQKCILKFLLAIELCGECAKVLQTRIQGCNLAGVHGEDLGPMRPSRERRQFCLDLWKQVQDRIPLWLPGEVDGKG